MTEDQLIAIEPNEHELQCPHCHEKIVHNSPGKTILFATVQCTHCGAEFLVTMDKTRAWRLR